jgi:uncharacterized membrane protein YkoI
MPLMRLIPACIAISFTLVLPAAAAGHLTVDEVRDMAFAKGVVMIKEIELDHGVWQVEGRGADGHKIKIEVDAASGEIVKIKRH